MKKFGSLVVKGTHQGLISLLAGLKNTQSAEFVCDNKLSEDYARNIFLKPDEAACFRAQGADYFDSTIWMVIQNGELRVANIVPGSVTSLSIAQYNVILSAFFHHFVAPQLKSQNAVYIDGEDVSIADLLPDDCYKKLKIWVNTCNQDSPILHPADEELWFDFLVSMSELPIEQRLLAGYLITWLQEDCHWSATYRPERFENLVQAYEYGLSLLDFKSRCK